MHRKLFSSSFLALAPVLCCFCFSGCHGNVPLSPQASPRASSTGSVARQTLFFELIQLINPVQVFF